MSDDRMVDRVFPKPEPTMSLRDYFAGQCFSVLILADGSEDYEEAARDAYRRADALIKAREAQS